MAARLGCSQLAEAIRGVASAPERRDAFILEEAQQIRELQRKSVQEYENAVASLLICLETFNVIEGNPVDVMCELTTLDILFNLELSAFQIAQCNSYVKLCLKAVSDSRTAVAAAKTLGDTVTKSVASEFLREQIDEAMRRAAQPRPRVPDARATAWKICGVLVLTEVAVKMPMLIFPKLTELLDALWDCLEDANEEVRTVAVALFATSIKLVNSRAASHRAEMYSSLIHRMRSNLSASKNEKNIAGLLAFESIAAGAMSSASRPRYEDLSILLMPFMMAGKTAHISDQVRKLLFRSLFVLCSYSTPMFVANQLKDTVSFALGSIRRNVQRSEAFEMLSRLVPLVGKKAYEPFVEDTILATRNIFDHSTEPCWEALHCFSVVCKVCLPHDMEMHVDRCIDTVFGWGPTAQLIESMRVIIASSGAKYRSKLEESLLDMISITLCGLPFRQQPITRKYSMRASEADATESQVSVALNALLQFGFSNSELMGDFLRDSVLPFIDDESEPVRNAAVNAIVKLLIPPGEKSNLSIARRMCIDSVISRMLVVGVADSSPSVRQMIMASFTKEFYPFLSEPQFLSHLHSALGDESIDCRVAVVEQLCCMIDYDPSHVLPSLRKEMLKILHFISCSFSIDTMRNGLRLLTAVANKAPQLVVNFMDGILEALDPHFETVTARSAILLSILQCATAVAMARRLSAKAVHNPVKQIAKVCELLENLPSDRSSHGCRLACLSFLSATLAPQMSGETPYNLFPLLFRKLASILRSSEEHIEIRLEALRCVGAIGALDTHTFSALGISEGNTQKSHEKIIFGKLNHQMCCRVVLSAIAVLIDPSEKRYVGSTDSLLRSVVRTVLSIGECCPPSRTEIGVVIPSLVLAIRNLPEGRLLGTMMYELTNVIRIAGESSVEYIEQLLSLLTTIWSTSPRYRFLFVRMASVLATFNATANQHFSKTHAKILPMVIDSINGPTSSEYLKYSVLEFIVRNVSTLEPFADTVVSNLLAAIQNPRNTIEFVTEAVTALREVSRKLSIQEQAGAIVRCLLARLSTLFATGSSAQETYPLCLRIMSVFNVLIVNLQMDFIKFSASIVRLLRTHNVACSEFGYMNSQLNKGLRCTISPQMNAHFSTENAELLKMCEHVVLKGMSQYSDIWNYTNTSDTSFSPASSEDRVLPISEQRILGFLRSVPGCKDEWLKWINQFAVRILEQSPYQVFRYVSLPMGSNATPFVERVPEFAQDMLRISFRAMWTMSSASIRTAIAEFFRQTLRQAMNSSTVPDEVITVFLSVAEYMDIAGYTLPISTTDLSECAWKRGMLAKALYWREAAFRENPESATQELVTLYSELRLVDSAVSILNMANDEQRGSLMQSNLVKLSRFKEALDLLDQEYKANGSMSSGESRIPSLSHKNLKSHLYSFHARVPSDSQSSQSRLEDIQHDRRVEIDAQRMLCWSELGDFQSVLAEWTKCFKSLSEKVTEDQENSILVYISPFAADAALRLQSWDFLRDVLPWMPKDTVQFHVSTAAYNVCRHQYAEAMAAVTEARRILLHDLSGLLHESYGRAYEGFIIAQELFELEEVIQARSRGADKPRAELIDAVRSLWDDRINTMAPTVAVWKQVLRIRGLLIKPADDVETRVRFVKLCRREGAKQMEKFALEQLLGTTTPKYDQLMSRTANPTVVMEYISYLSSVGEIEQVPGYGTEKELLRNFIEVHRKADHPRFLARAYVRLGKRLSGVEAVNCYDAATLYDPTWHIAWRLWAEANSEVLNTTYTEEACCNAIVGYVQSILLSPDQLSIHDVLRLLTLWSRHADDEKGLSNLRKRVLEVPARVWLLVVPQLIARLDSGSDESCQLTATILSTVAEEFPQSLIYPLNLCTMSDSERRNKWANDIIRKMCGKYGNIVSQGTMLINELVRSSVLIYEEWYDALESAATAFFGRLDHNAMLNILMPLHDNFTNSPETLVEVEFVSKYSQPLEEARTWLQSYLRTGMAADLQSAWNMYHTIYRQIDEQVKLNSVLHMHACSPKLFEVRNLEIGIPNPRPKDGADTIHIASFHNDIVVIASKQRPKRIALTSSEGNMEKYLLKGREDLRLDERVMQLFRLVSTLLLADTRSSKNFGYQIQQYSVTPLKDTVGLIGWVDGCDTMHELVRSYRTPRNIPVELEMRMLNQIITFDNPKAYDHLTIMSKVEAVEFLADHTSGHDIRKAMWSLATNCEVWLERRQMYTTSLGAMSAVGYILGLGDRHPNNIMIQKDTGLVVHIDFGDCFEVAMTRDKFPEKVPFRLTRMLRNALEVSEVDGAFRSSMEVAMSVLRKGNHSVVALLEAFIQDPLISWRLVNRPGEEPEASTDHKTIEEQITSAKLQGDGAVIDYSANAAPLFQLVGNGGFSSGLSHSPRRTWTYLGNSLLFTAADDVAHKGVTVLNRLSCKLRGLEFARKEGRSEGMNTKMQVSRLISEATNVENVAQSWSGWYPFW